MYSSESFSSACGTTPAASYSVPMWISRVASPPSSTIESGPEPSGQVSICSVHHQYSSSVSPFHAYTETPCGLSTVPFGPTTTAAAAWSCVEKMLQLTQRTSAPSATRVSMRTAVCTVMCSDPATFLPFSGWDGPNSRRSAIRPGHLVLGELDLLAAERGEAQVGDLEVGDAAGRVGAEGDAHVLSFCGVLAVARRFPAWRAGGRCRLRVGRRSDGSARTSRPRIGRDADRCASAARRRCR